MDLSAETAVVTGASRGIGRAIAAALAAHGANVALWSRDERSVTAAAGEIASVGEGRVAARAVDVRDRGEVEKAVTDTIGELGPITLLVNNAGTAGPADVDWEADPDEWWECVETTLRGSFLCARSVLPADQAGSLWNVEVGELNRHLRRSLHTEDGDYGIPLELVHQRLQRPR